MADALVEIVPLYTVIIVDTMFRIALCEIQHNIWIKLLSLHCSIRFKVEKAKLYTLKQVIVFHNTTAIATIINDHTIITLRQHFGLHTVPVLIKVRFVHAHPSNRLVMAYSSL